MPVVGSGFGCSGWLVLAWPGFESGLLRQTWQRGLVTTTEAIPGDTDHSSTWAPTPYPVDLKDPTLRAF